MYSVLVHLIFGGTLQKSHLFTAIFLIENIGTTHLTLSLHFYHYKDNKNSCNVYCKKIKCTINI